MKDIDSGSFFNRLQKKKICFPLNGHLELTYKCTLDCVHCYCKGQVGKELDTREWKKIIDTIYKEGCLYLIFTGGDPLIRKDFLELYAYAKEKGFVITIFTNGQCFSKETIDYLAKSLPYSIEITLNGVTKNTYEAITKTKGSFKKAITAIKLLKDKHISLVLKANCLKQNKHELGKIKAFTDNLLGSLHKEKIGFRKVKIEGRWHFKYDPMIYPRLNADKTPNDFRLSFAELEKLKKQDADIWKEYEAGLHGSLPKLKKDRNFLYRCNSWMQQFFVNPYGRLKFCMFSDKYSVELNKVPFKEVFYSWPYFLLRERFKTDSKCKDCNLKPVCYHCPARAYLETGDEEAPVPYYCQLAEETAKRMKIKEVSNA